jgi:hypothetical protein
MISRRENVPEMFRLRVFRGEIRPASYSGFVPAVKGNAGVELAVAV